MSDCRLKVENEDIVIDEYLKKDKNSLFVDKMVLDIGANEGKFSEKFLSYGAKHVIGFEPSSVLCKISEERLNELGYTDKDFTIFNNGISDSVSKIEGVTFVNCWTLGTSSSTGLPVSPGAQDIVGKDSFDVSLITLDSALDEGLFANYDINFIKVDVDGYEAKLLRGATKFIDKYKPIILFELSFLPNNCGDDVYEMIDFIFDVLKYRIFKVDGEEVSREFIVENFPWHTSCDIILKP